MRISDWSSDVCFSDLSIATYCEPPRLLSCFSSRRPRQKPAGNSGRDSFDRLLRQVFDAQSCRIKNVVQPVAEDVDALIVDSVAGGEQQILMSGPDLARVEKIGRAHV